MSEGANILVHPGTIVLNGVPYNVVEDERSGELAWKEDPTTKQAPTVERQGVVRTSVGTTSGTKGYIAEEVQDSWHMGMGDALGLRRNTYHYSAGGDLRYPGQIILPPLATTLTTAAAIATVSAAGFFELGSRLYTWAHATLYEVGTPSGGFTVTADPPGGSGSLNNAVVFRNTALLGFSASDFRYRASGGAPGTFNSAAAGLRGNFFALNENFVYRVDDDSTPAILAACPVESDPAVAASWVSPINIDLGDREFWFLTSYGYQILVGTTRGVFITNREGRIPTLFAPAEVFRFSTDVTVRPQPVDYKGQIFMAFPNQLVKYDGLTISRVAADSEESNLGPIGNTYNALATDQKWLYMSELESNGAILAYKETEGIGVRHSLIGAGSQEYLSLHCTGLTDPLSLWGQYVDGNLDFVLTRWNFPSNVDNPLQDAAYTYASSGTVYLSRFYLGTPYTTKNFLGLTLEIDNLSADETVAVAYRTSVNTPWSASSPSWTTAGTYNNTTTSGTELTLTNVSGRFIELRLTMARGSTTTKTPVIRRVSVRALERPTFYRTIQTTVRLDYAEMYEGLVGAVADDTVDTRYDNLRALEGGTTGLTLIDPWGNSRTVFLVGAVEAKPKSFQPSSDPDALIELTMLEP